MTWVRRRRLQGWAIEEHEDGSFSLSHGNRSIAAGLHTRSAVMAYLQKNHRPGERIYHVERDGYRTEITRQFRRAQLAR
jgi:hypothetical protein